MKSNTKLILSGVTAALFLLLIVLLRTVDVAAIGPQGTSVGLSALNGAFAGLVGQNMTWYAVSEVLGKATFLLGFAWGVLGFCQLIKRRSLTRVDSRILLLGVLYITMGLFYLLFSVVTVNCRPVVLPDELVPESSFPSSHTMLAIIILNSSMKMVKYYLKTTPHVIEIIKAALALMMVVLVLSRVLSGCHWFTDIIGSLLISSSLLLAFRGLLPRSSSLFQACWDLLPSRRHE